MENHGKWTLEERAIGLSIISLTIMKTINADLREDIQKKLEEHAQECFRPVDPLVRPTDRSGVGRFLQEFLKEASRT